MIYFAQTPTGSIKIGCTMDLGSRLQVLKSHYGAELALLATMPGDLPEETEIHERFSHLRLGKTEQFQPGVDLMEFIGKPLLVNPDPGTVEAQARAIEVKAVRLDLTPKDHDRLDKQARKRGLTKASYDRMLIFEIFDEQEGSK